MRDQRYRYPSVATATARSTTAIYPTTILGSIKLESLLYFISYKVLSAFPRLKMSLYTYYALRAYPEGRPALLGLLLGLLRLLYLRESRTSLASPLYRLVLL
ncbi:uncharacterized protein MYCGRDRAFT_95476 [Zymoseptoria tritici IPO323]|uniref:Uncharacterized protein n=1 Tax=Zymoseptoria tritici (strain CBS 115943 / IPO323) TaxID=336722 RepID=F9XPK4_ZYMTI|nr:uncharacterized protein MYCGRDRAFT_97241 [Zymoseptoria tritici IPO323]XP_003850200.1 uncharacterized protein MYCGRDRAFT_95476 [Zymoseptoria tritici IPO323]EGP82482.1 hypothetical protein MYCGRDRAFT_97241 [Zymoseptoria tritici IPO323]EGP85176.1 hypothetical protein MYCGRDRAFT_95476 [Zymoseptoria tritici IPO323]